MNRIRRATLLGTITAAAAAVALTVASVSAAGTETHMLRLVERGGSLKFVDLPPRAKHQGDLSPGDMALISRNLYPRSAGAAAGSMLIACVAVTAAKQQCTGTIYVSGGTLEVAGISQFSPTTAIVVTGGTGAYRDAHGSAVARDVPGKQDVANLTINLS